MDVDLMVSIVGMAIGFPSFVLGVVVDRMARRSRLEQHWRHLLEEVDRFDRASLWFVGLVHDAHQRNRRGISLEPARRRQIVEALDEMDEARERMVRAFDDRHTPPTLSRDLKLWPPEFSEAVWIHTRSWVLDYLHPALMAVSDELEALLDGQRR